MNDILSQVGKAAVVTGGASGIGLQTVKLFCEYGARVCAVDISEPREPLPDGAVFFRCDVTAEADVRALAAFVEETFGRLDVLFNNAGVIRRKCATELLEREWDLVVDVTLKGAFLCCKHLIPLMARAGGGSIVNTGSGWGLKGGDQAVSYCAAKGGIVNMTRALAIDHGPQNIRVNCVCPGDTDTPLLRDEGHQLGVDEKAFLASSGVGRPLARIGQPIDIANAVLFFCSDLALWITGTALPVDGGGIA
ncbi:MAG: SDR family oxidoreductase [Clostridia bacterium]